MIQRELFMNKLRNKRKKGKARKKRGDRAATKREKNS